MTNRLFGGNGSSKGFTKVDTLGPGWVVIAASPTAPPPPGDLPFALSQGLHQWLCAHPTIRIRSTLPIIRDGNTIGIHVWYDAS